MKKGFTLVELLAVIVILAIILAIAIPGIGTIIEKSKVSSYNSQMDLIKRATSLYVSQYGDGSTTSVRLDQLISKGLISSNIKNPITNQPFDNITIDVSGENAYAVYEGPDLATGMIPVYYDEAARVWKKANKNNPNNSWYDYNNFKWANAVTVGTNASETNKDGIPNKSRNDYLSADVGTPISIDDINTMWVWIPRYSYLIPSGEGPREIKIKFETKYTPKSKGDAVSTYYTHPAFTFGEAEVNGLWIGKFETTGEITSPTILPDLSALRVQSVKAIYENVKAYMQGSSTFGFSNDNETHMMKNTEWGAVAYLSHSKYGKYGNPTYEGANKEIYINNSGDYNTGRSGGRPGYEPGYTTSEGCFAYDGIIKTNNGACDSTNNFVLAAGESVGSKLNNDKLSLAYGASTTGTIYGIYDMSGGVHEYVMGVLVPNPIPETGMRDCSGYSTNYAPPTACPETGPYDSQYNHLIIDTKYYDRYLKTVPQTGYIKGDGTYEVSGWYGDRTSFLNAQNPWFSRGDLYSNRAYAGIFGFNFNTGKVSNSSGFRIILLVGTEL